jgi:hypothetical protein
VRAASTCPAKKSAIEKVRKELDSEYGLPLLQQMAKPTCGANRKTDCWPCLDKLLPETIKDLEKPKK